MIPMQSQHNLTAQALIDVLKSKFFFFFSNEERVRAAVHQGTRMALTNYSSTYPTPQDAIAAMSPDNLKFDLLINQHDIPSGYGRIQISAIRPDRMSRQLFGVFSFKTTFVGGKEVMDLDYIPHFAEGDINSNPNVVCPWVRPYSGAKMSNLDYHEMLSCFIDPDEDNEINKAAIEIWFYSYLRLASIQIMSGYSAPVARNDSVDFSYWLNSKNQHLSEDNFTPDDIEQFVLDMTYLELTDSVFLSVLTKDRRYVFTVPVFFGEQDGRKYLKQLFRDQINPVVHEK
jgi:hypothetical protein